MRPIDSQEKANALSNAAGKARAKVMMWAQDPGNALNDEELHSDYAEKSSPLAAEFLAVAPVEYRMCFFGLQVQAKLWVYFMLVRFTRPGSLVTVMTSAADSTVGVRKTPYILTGPAAFFGPLVSAAGATMAPLSTMQESGLAPWIQWISGTRFFVIGLLCIAVGIFWTSLGAKRQTSEADKLRAELQAHEGVLARKVSYMRLKTSEGIVHQLSPIVHDLGNLIESKQMNHGGTLIDRCLNAVIQIIGVEDVRACLYYLDQVESKEASATDILNGLSVRLPQVGRNDVPRASFIRGEGAYATGIFKVVDTGTSRIITDVDLDSDVTDCIEKRYKTFMNVAVKFKTEEIGILSVDAPIAGTLTNNHMLLAEMIANIIAIGMWREKKRSVGKFPNPGPYIGNVPLNPAADGNS